MNTAALKKFATTARTALIRDVTARLKAVLLPGSPERVERPEAVAALEKAIKEAGGDAKGQAAVAERIAYTWFNRIVALRYLDAAGYSTIGTVSPRQGQTIGQPEVLSQAKAGNFDGNVVPASTEAAVTALLNGTRRSTDAQGEAYALLLSAYCRHWHRTMPFMFEPEGDWTELLVPSNLLSDDSVLNQALAVLTPDVCKDVEVIGWLYQYYISERKDEVFADFKKNKKAGANEIPAATQLFTPDWIVRYLVDNSLGRLWMLNHPNSHLTDHMEYYISPVETPESFLKINSPEEIKVLDPAAGSGHMLTYAFDLLYAIYEEEGYAPADIPSLILKNNLFGVEIDPRAGTLAAFALTMKARERQRTFFNKGVQPNICVLQNIPGTAFANADTFGSLIRPTITVEDVDISKAGDDLFTDSETARRHQLQRQISYLAPGQYHVVVTNPPYMGAKNMNAALAEYLKREYPQTKADLFSAFIERCLELVLPGGQLGFMTPYVWMFIKTYEPLRKMLLKGETITSLIQLEYSGFDGATVPICTFTLERGHRPNYQGGFVRLADFVGAKLQAPRALEAIQDQSKSWFYRAKSTDFQAIPGTPIVYWLSEKMRAAFKKGKPLGDISEPRVGLQTGDNGRFTRLWWEVNATDTATDCADRSVSVEMKTRWFPYNKGGDFRKWYGNQDILVNWERDGAEIRAFGTEDGGRPRSRAQNTNTYFRPSISWSKISSGAPAFRYYPEGFIYDVAGTSIFANNDNLRFVILAFSNSSTAFELLTALAPTLNFEVGQVAQLPVMSKEGIISINQIPPLIDGAKEDWNSYESSWEFSENVTVNIYRTL